MTLASRFLIGLITCFATHDGISAVARAVYAADVGAAVASSAAYTEFGIGTPEITPLSELSALHAPVLILHGTADTVVPVQQARDYEAAIQASGKPYESHYYDGAPHGVGLNGPTVADSMLRALAFYRNWL